MVNNPLYKLQLLKCNTLEITFKVFAPDKLVSTDKTNIKY